MGFQRGRENCVVMGCGGQAEYSLIAHARTSGGRKDRVMKTSDTVRICYTHADEVKQGKIPKQLLAAFQQAVKRVQGER